MKKFFVCSMAAFLCAGSAQAAAILGLYNTGVQSGGAGWGAGAGQKPGNGADLHWDLDVSPQAFTGNPIAAAWISNSTSLASRWITPKPNGVTSFDPATPVVYTYSTSFDLSGFDPATASFAGRFAADNTVDSIFLNGTQIGSGGSFSDWSEFAASTGFVSGLNTLEFVVRNFAQDGGNPTGLRVEFSDSNVNVVPEPASWAMMIAGFAAVGFAMRRRRQTVRVSFA
jgi:hypothetical protein